MVSGRGFNSGIRSWEERSDGSGWEEGERGRELVESRRCGGCYVLAQRPRSKLVSTRGEEEGGKGGRLESPPLPFIPGHLPKDIIIVLKQVRDILPSFGYGVQMVRLKYIESERESSFIHHYPLIHANLT